MEYRDGRIRGFWRNETRDTALKRVSCSATRFDFFISDIDVTTENLPYHKKAEKLKSVIEDVGKERLCTKLLLGARREILSYLKSFEYYGKIQF